MVDKCLLEVVLSYLRGKFIRAKDCYTYSARNANSYLFVPLVSNHAAKNLFCYEEAVLFNILGTFVKTSQTYKEFKFDMKLVLTILYIIF